jgi:DNA topoisomerase-2
MIIDGILVVSKKKKAVLIAELKNLNFKPFPKVDDAKKAGEDEDVENDDSEDADDVVGANDYDYLLGMPIWSLTMERIDRIKKQIGDKEAEINELIKLTPKDIWNKDLDDFLEEWNTQLADEAQRKKRFRAGGRRASAKLGIGAGKKKKQRRDSDDSDFEVSKKKSSALSTIQDRVKNKKGLASFFYNDAPSKAVLEDRPTAPKPGVTLSSMAASKVQPVADDIDFMDIEEFDAKPRAEQGHDSEVVAVKKKGRTAGIKNKPKAAPSKLKPVDSDSEDDPFVAAAEEAPVKKSTAPARAARAKATSKYVVNESDSDFDDDKLGDLSMMIKPLGQSTAATGRTLFTEPTRPGSSHGLTNQKTKSKSKSPIDSDNGIDDTDYHALVQSSPRRPAARTLNEAIDLSDDDDDFGVPVREPTAAPKTKATTSKIAAAKVTTSKPVIKKVASKKAATAAPAKIMPLSPAAKVYAAKKAKVTATLNATSKKKVVESDDNEEMDDIANDILSDEEMEDEAPIARPSRRAVASKPKYQVDSDDEEASEEEDYDDDDDSE